MLVRIANRHAIDYIGVAPNYAVYVRNKNQGSSTNVVKVIFPYLKEQLLIHYYHSF